VGGLKVAEASRSKVLEKILGKIGSLDLSGPMVEEGDTQTDSNHLIPGNPKTPA